MIPLEESYCWDRFPIIQCFGWAFIDCFSLAHCWINDAWLIATKRQNDASIFRRFIWVQLVHLKIFITFLNQKNCDYMFFTLASNQGYIGRTWPKPMASIASAVKQTWRRDGGEFCIKWKWKLTLPPFCFLFDNSFSVAVNHPNNRPCIPFKLHSI